MCSVMFGAVRCGGRC